MRKELSFEKWVETVPNRVRSDPLWRSEYYQLAMCLYDPAWSDCELMMNDLRDREIARQMIRSVGSVCANIEEAYGRGIESADALRILRISLGEARETRGWYVRSRHLLPEDLLERRLDLVGQVLGKLVSIIAGRHHKGN